MKQYIRKTLPEEFFTQPAYLRALTLGLVYCFLVVMQLFSYEKFYQVVNEYMLPGGNITAIVVAGLIPIVEVAALPFLLSMKLKDSVRSISKGAVIVVPAIWTLLAGWLFMTADVSVLSGLLGATLPIVSGLWFVVFSLLLLWSAVLVVRELPKRR